MANSGNKDDSEPSSRGLSFVKVILNHEYLDTLCLPPKFAKGLKLLPSQKIQIKDITGRYWHVTLSYVEDHLAFGRGWDTFVLDHGIEISDAVGVVYTSGSEFVCLIFGKNGCLKRQFLSASCNTASLDSTDKDSSTFSNSRVNVTFTHSNKERSSISHGKGQKRKPFEDPCCIVNREIDLAPVDRRSLLDQSEFEMCKPASEMGSSFVDDLVDFSAFDDAMRTSSVIENKDSSKHETSEQVLPERCPSASVETSVEEQRTGAFQTPTTTAKDQDSKLHMHNSAGPSLEAQTAAFPCQTTTRGDEGPSVEAQTTDLEAQTAAFQGQTTTLRYQNAVKNPERNGISRGESVAIANNQNMNFNPEGFGGSVRIVKEERKEFNFGGSVRNVKEEHKMLNPKGFGGGVRMVKEEQMKFNPMTSGPSMEAQTAAFHTGGSVGHVKKEHKMLNPEGFGGVRIVKEERMEFSPKTVGGVAQRVQERYMAKGFGKVKKEPMNFNPEPFGNNHYSNGHQENGTSQVLKRVKTEAADFVDPPPPLAVTCLATIDKNFLVLPTDFSLLGYKRTMDLEKKVVVLRDPAQKLWSLLCCNINGLQVLTSGWKSFREANGIQTGDECIFQVEDKFESIFKVNVVRKA